MTLKQASVSEAGRLDVVAAAVFELSRSRAATLIKQGAVSVAGVLHTRPSFQVELGALLRIELPPAEPDQALPEELPLSIVYEDDDLIVVDKASGMVVHPGPGHSGGTLVNALLFHIDTLSGIGGVLRPGIVHRLDKGTSGLMVVAKNDAAHQGLSEQFAAHSAGRRYLAICFGRARQDAGRAESYLARHPKDRVRIASTDGSYGKHAVTHWELLGQAELACLIECRLETGRTHQVRVHLTEMGCPLIGDSLYRRKKNPLSRKLREALPEERPLLHAWRLEFNHPLTGEPKRFESWPPEDFLKALEVLGLQPPIKRLSSAAT